MRLVNLSKKDDTYMVKAIIPFRILGLTIASPARVFIYQEKNNNWKTSKGGKVSKKKKMILNKWLRDHKRFIE